MDLNSAMIKAGLVTSIEARYARLDIRQLKAERNRMIRAAIRGADHTDDLRAVNRALRALLTAR